MRETAEKLDPEIYGTKQRMLGMISLASEELDEPFYYGFNDIFSVMKMSCPPEKKFRSALLNAGYKVSKSHASRISMKTNAPPQFVWQIAKNWVRQQGVEESKFKLGSSGARLFTNIKDIDIDWSIHRNAVMESEREHMLRYQDNPLPNWGPMSRAGRDKYM